MVDDPTQADLGARLREARLSSNISQQVAAEQLGVDRSALVRIESGERKVSALELSRLATAYELPLSYFLMRAPAAITSRRQEISEDASSSDRSRFKMDAALELHWRDAELLLSWGYLTVVAPMSSAVLSGRGDAQSFARMARARLGMQSGPLGSMAGLAERLGLFVLVVDHAREGASLTPTPGFGVAVIGAQAEPGRRRFTAAHELGHHLLGDEYRSDVAVSAARDERERMIDAFAAELLLPEADVVGQWEGLPGTEWERVVQFAGRYRVSWSVAIQVAQSSGAIDRSAARRLQPRTPRRGDFLSLLERGPAEDLPAGQTGRGWQKAVLLAYAGARINGPRALEMLHGALQPDDLPDAPEPRP